MRGLFVLLAAAVLPGCATTVIHTRMDAQRLAPATAAPGTGAARLACPYALVGVVDAREGSQSGGLGRKAFDFADAADAVQRQLLEAGFVPAQDRQVPGVEVRIRQLYLSQNTITKVPVAVYEVLPSDSARFVVRAQPTSMNWAGSLDEAYGAYAAAMRDANRQLVQQLNARCAGRRGA